MINERNEEIKGKGKNNKGETERPEEEKENQIISDYFKSLREEIHIRIREHTRLVWIKILSLGMMMFFFIRRSYDTEMRTALLEPSFSFLVCMIPLAAVIFDFLIAGNIRIINNLGYYIKVYIESEAFEEITDKINRRLEGKVLFKIKITEKLKELVRRKDKSKRDKKKIRNEIESEFKKNGFKIGEKIEIKKERKYIIVDGKREFGIKFKKNHLEVSYLKFGFWENKAAQSLPKHKCFTSWDILVIWLFTLASGIFSTWFQFQHVLVNSVIIIPFISVGIFIPFVRLLSSIKMERRF